MKHLIYENKTLEKNYKKSESKVESLQKLITEVLTKSKKDDKLIESLKQQLENASLNTKIDMNNANQINNKLNSDWINISKLNESLQKDKLDHFNENSFPPMFPYK